MTLVLTEVKALLEPQSYLAPHTAIKKLTVLLV